MVQKAYLGIDVGSISTNLVLMTPSKEIIGELYLYTGGMPIEAVFKGLGELRKK
ncbi:2-hydroxyglutaryl-CoA dehydratase, partial [Candidatus Woesearchaeota archaeon CG_4_10_14_0_8_um_filter_47_5]